MAKLKIPKAWFYCDFSFQHRFQESDFQDHLRPQEIVRNINEIETLLSSKKCF